jgi:site-specific DNA-methyltransferase (adenine-specific)
LARRHLDKGQKIALALEIEPHFAEEARRRHDEQAKRNLGLPTVEKVPPSGTGKSRDQAAAAVGVSGKLVSAAKAIREADPVRFEKVKQGKLSVAKAKKELKAEQDKRDLAAAQKRVDADKRNKVESVCDLRVCSCRDLFASGIKPDAVITDPPYPQEFLLVFTELAEGCKAAGVPLVAVMSGQSYLPEVMRRLCEHLRYRWTLAYMTPGGQAVQQWQAKVNTAWKPVLLFGEAGEWFGDVAVSKPNDNDKRFHGWGQSESGMADLVERLTKPGQLVCDPFLGGGTTAVVSLALGRRFVGCDIDAAHVEQARTRVMQ